MRKSKSLYKRYRFPADIIRYAVWRYCQLQGESVRLTWWKTGNHFIMDTNSLQKSWTMRSGCIIAFAWVLEMLRIYSLNVGSRSHMDPFDNGVTIPSRAPNYGRYPLTIARWKSIFLFAAYSQRIPGILVEWCPSELDREEKEIVFRIWSCPGNPWPHTQYSLLANHKSACRS